jgi:microcystin degradation protein MlrC
MKVVIAQMKHETNTFSPVPTPLARFARGLDTPPAGEEAIAAYRGTGSAIAAFIELAEKAGATIEVPIAANAWPSGPVHDDAFETMVSRICDSVADGCDAVLLDLHGAMVTQSLDDGEGELLTRLRKINPTVPIGLALDMHTNLYPAIADQVNVLAGYQTYPHVDVYETGLRAARPIFSMLEGRCNPTIAWGNRPMLPHVMRQSSLDEPNQSIQARAIEMESQGVLAATVFVGFPHADIVNAGLSSVVVSDGDPAKASQYCNELLDAAWDQRHAFVYEIEPLAASVQRAATVSGAPVVLLDHYDNAASGGTMDTMAVLDEIMRAGLKDVAAFAIYDPQVVAQLTEAGLGANVTVSLGGKMDMPSIGMKGQPCEVTGTVKRLTDGQFRNRGPMSKGELMDMGPTAVLDTGNVEIVIISRQQEPNDLECFYSVGIDPLKKHYLMLKSRVHWRAGMGEIAQHTVECAGVGVCTSDYDTLKFDRVRRPVFPLDNI